MRLIIIRHGATKGNQESRYVGLTDEDITDEAIDNLLKKKELLPTVNQVYVSPMLRCKHTAKLLFPDAEQITVDELRECDFGKFEYMNYAELNGNPDYQRFIDTGGECGFPGGETKEEFCKRTIGAFWTIIDSARVKGITDVVIVAHGGTIMAIFDAYAEGEKSFYDWQPLNGCGYEGTLSYEGYDIMNIKEVFTEEEK